MKKISKLKLFTVVVLLVSILLNVILLIRGQRQKQVLAEQRQAVTELEQQLASSLRLWQRSSDLDILYLSPFRAEVNRRLTSESGKHGVSAMAVMDGDKVGLLQQISTSLANDFVVSSVKIMKKLFPEGERNVAGCLGEQADEVYIFLSGRNSREEIIEDFKQMLREIRKIDLCANGQVFHNSYSVGIAFVSQDAQTFEKLFTQADQALSRAKANGKDTYFVYGSSFVPERETPPHNPKFLTDMIEQVKRKHANNTK